MIPRRFVIPAALIAFSFAAPAVQSAGPAISGVSVDVTELRQAGLGPLADRFGACLTRRISAAFADRTSPGGARLVVRMKGVQLSSSNIGGGSGGMSVGSDYIEGDLMLVDRSGAVIARRPLLTSLQANSGGAWYSDGVETRRVEAICGQFAGWAKRTI